MKFEFWSSTFYYSCVGQFVHQIAPNQTITYVRDSKSAPAFTWLKTDRRSSLLLCLRTVTTLANSLAAVSPTWSGIAFCALCNSSRIVATLLDAVLPMCGGSNTSDRGLFPDAINRQKIIPVEIFFILLEKLTIVHVTSCYETWSRKLKYFRCNDRQKNGTFQKLYYLLTLLEHRVLGYIHIHWGSNNVGFLVLFNLLQMLLGCFLESSIFRWFQIL